MIAPAARPFRCFCSLFRAKGSIVLAIVGLLSLGCAPHAAGQANLQGQWQTLPNTMPINPVHAALLHNGKVLIVSGSGNLPTETNWRAAIFDPGTGSVTTQPVGWDMFCNGMVVLADGRVFVNGGTLQYDPFHGELRSAIYDPSTGKFSDVQTMAHGRWYPTVTNLSDGTVMTFSGLDENSNTNSTVEIYTVGSGWSTTYGSPFTPPLYPRLHLIPNGKVFYSGSTTGSRYFDPSAHTWSGVVATTKYSGTRTYGTSVLLPLTPANNYKPVVMIMGGGNPATNTTELIDLSAASPAWAFGPAMSQARIEMNATILPNGKVIALGGSVNDEDTNTASLQADLYDPATNKFSSAGQNVYARLYHSNSLLLPDARVLVIGGNPARGTYEPHIEIYSPPYLFNSSGTAATRPSITSVPSTGIGYGAGFQVQTPDAQNISSVVLIRPGAPTHAFDMDQRMVGLSFTAGASVLNVTAPPNANIAPPGYYMVFLLNSSGVPSVAQFVLLTRTPSDIPPTGTITSPSTDVTINAGQSVLFSGTGSDPDGTVTGYSWTFSGGNPSTSSLATPGNVTYSSPGTFTATLTVTDNANLTDPTPPTRTITVTATQAPAITSASSTTFSVGTAGTFSVTTTGAPTPTITETGTLPSGVTFTDNGNGTATLGGTPAVGTVGAYPITIKAHNGVGTDATQNFTLTVNGGGSGSSNFAYVNGSVTGVFNPSGSANATLSVGLHQNPGAGHLLLCAATWQSPTATAAMSDPNNGAWKAAGSAKPGTGSLTGYSGQIFYVPAAVSAPTTVTMTISTAVVFRSLECAEYSYTGSISSPDGTPQYSTVPASGGVATVGGLTTSNSNDLVFAACLGVDSTCAVGTGYTLHDDTNSLNAGNGTLGNSFLAHTGQSIEEKVGVAAGAQSATFKTGTNSDNVILGLLAF
jgi:galactose oxidase-like protein/PKD domain-containing protein